MLTVIKLIRRKFANRSSWHGYKSKLTLPDINKFLDSANIGGQTLNIYCDVEWPNAEFTFPDYKSTGSINMYLKHISSIADESYDTIIAVGLLEHLPNPGDFLDGCWRILKPGGKMVLRVSSVFSLHVGPNDYFHFTKYGLLELLKTQSWQINLLRGSSQPYKTSAILLQRILLQAKSKFISRLITHLLIFLLLKLDGSIISQYEDTSYSEEKIVDSMAPSNIEAILTKVLA
jgi:SAM-dependent methyltransferase